MHEFDLFDVPGGRLPRFLVEFSHRPAGFASIPPIRPDDATPVTDVMAKPNETTFIYDGYVYKRFADPHRCGARVARAKTMDLRVPKVTLINPWWYSYPYVKGELLSERTSRLLDFLGWMHTRCWSYRVNAEGWAESFYVEKTARRIAGRDGADEIIDQIRRRCDGYWTPWLCPYWHGDCSFENVVIVGGEYKLLDWREDAWGDVAYDLVKLLKSAMFDHRTVKSDGTWQAHKNANALRNLIFDYAKQRLGICIPYLRQIEAVHMLAMSGSHEGPLGDNLYKKGVELWQACSL